ncbi:uncharacterized protein LOC143914864 isoform X2 [Arctopsyche grandis]|uniref:uncharacterized protein LOC143914864 isoform X2 n=1 Tax=Arctopsyche grandis TaxID=121162 RepID=UPI00406D9ED8
MTPGSKGYSLAGGGSSGGGVRACCPAPLARLRVEKIEGGLLVAGVVVAANCQLVLPIFGFLFLLVGCVLTAASYRGPGADEGPEHYAARVAFTGTSRALGPACVATGALMAALGALLCVLARRAARRRRRVGFHCPLHGDFFPLSPAATARTIAAIEKGESRWRQWCPSAPQCPRSQTSSTKSSPAAACPAPLPFLVTTGSITGLTAPGATLSPAQTFGSIRSLSGPREVASFPLSRTPSPPPLKTSICDTESGLDSPIPSGEQVETFSFVSSPHDFQAVECKMTTTEELNTNKENKKTCETEHLNAPRKSDASSVTSARKSVSIILPTNGKG